MEFHALPVWWSGFELAPSSAAYTASDSTLVVKLNVKNTAYAELHLGSTGGTIGVRYAGQSYSARDGGPILPQSTSVITVSAGSLPADFTLSAAELVFGTDDQHQVKIPLNGFTPTAVAPTPLARPADIRIAHTATRFMVTSARLIPARCDGNPVDVKYAPTTADEVSLDIVGTLGSTSTSRGGVAATQAGATAGGVTSPAVPFMNDVLGSSSSPLRRYHLCFPIPAGTHGAVTVAFMTRLVGDAGPTPGRTTVTLP